MSHQPPEEEPGFVPPAGPPPGPPPGQPGQPPGYGQGQPPGYGQQYGAPPAGWEGMQGYPSQAQPHGYGSAAGDPTLAEWWQRLLARILDSLVLGVVLVPLSLLTAGNGPTLLGQNVVVMIVGAILLFVYDTVQHATWGQTIGKRALGTKVVAISDRGPITSGAAASRAAVYGLVPNLIPCLGTLFALLNALWLFWDPNRQCLHDKAAGTIVVKTGVSGPYQPYQG